MARSKSGRPKAVARRGATLLEVLVSIFIMAIGLMALLVLFPLGALQMAQAIQNERAAQAAVSAGNFANLADIRHDTGLTAVSFGVNDPIFNPQLGTSGDAYLNPAPGILTNADPEKKSYPLLIDPVGYATAAGLGSQRSVANPPGAVVLLARKCVGSNVLRPAFLNFDIYRWFTFLDDLRFDKDGLALAVQANPPPAPPTVERDIRFSCAYLCQRPRTADVTNVDCAVVVYNSRPLGLTGNLDLPEFGYFRNDAVNGPEVIVDTTINTVRIYYGVGIFPQTAPPMRAGDWLLDVSITPTPSSVPGNAVVPDPHATFYRIAGVTLNDTASPPYVDYELQQPLRGFTTTVPTNSTGGNIGARFLFLEGVAEVFDRGAGKTP